MSAAITIIQGVLLGLGAAAPIGPVNVEIARRTLTGGFRAGVALGLGAVTVDVAYAILTSAGARLIREQRWLEWTLSVGGALLLAYLGWASLRAARRAWIDPLPPLARQKGRLGRGYAAGIAMTALNPMTLAFWFVAVPQAAEAASRGAGGVPLLCAGVFAGTLGWVLGFAGLLAVVGRRGRRVWLVAANLAGGVVLLYFAVRVAWQTVRPLL